MARCLHASLNIPSCLWIQHGHAIRDLNLREIITVLPLLIFIFWIGLYPKPFFALMAPAVENLVKMLPIP